MNNEISDDGVYPDTRLPIFLGNEFVEGFLGYIVDGELGEKPVYSDFKKAFTERIYTVNETQANYRTINHWGDTGLLLDDSERGSGWRKFNLIELCWLAVIQELRTVGFSLEKIKVLKDAIFKDGSVDGVQEDVSFLGYCLMNVIQRNDMLVVVDNTGRGTIIMEAQYLRSQKTRPLPQTMVTVSLNKIYATVADQPELKKKNQYLAPLSEKEMELLVNIKTNKELTGVNLKIKDNQIDRANFTTIKLNPENAVAEVREMLKNGERSEIIIRQENGKAVCIEVTTKT